MADVTIAGLPTATSAAGAVVAIEVDGQRFGAKLSQLIAAVQAAKGTA